LLFVRGPLPREGRPALGEKLEEGETLIDVATDGDHERARIAFQRDGKPWVADQRVVPLTSLACVLVVAQAPEAHAKAFTAATDALVASIASRTA
jgi:hypothetical protein